MTRREIFPRLAQIPYDTRLAIATVCKRLYYESSIDPLFIDNGCLLSWWMPPLKPVKSKRMARAIGWLDGIVLHAPDRECSIARAVCEEILRKPHVPQQVREEVISILQQLTLPTLVHPSAPQASGQPAPTHAPAPIDDPAAIIVLKRRRLQHLEGQRALKGSNTPPEVIIEIEDLRREIAALAGGGQRS